MKIGFTSIPGMRFLRTACCLVFIYSHVFGWSAEFEHLVLYEFRRGTTDQLSDSTILKYSEAPMIVDGQVGPDQPFHYFIRAIPMNRVSFSDGIYYLNWSANKLFEARTVEISVTYPRVVVPDSPDPILFYGSLTIPDEGDAKSATIESITVELHNRGRNRPGFPPGETIFATYLEKGTSIQSLLAGSTFSQLADIGPAIINDIDFGPHSVLDEGPDLSLGLSFGIGYPDQDTLTETLTLPSFHSGFEQSIPWEPSIIQFDEPDALRLVFPPFAQDITSNYVVVPITYQPLRSRIDTVRQLNFGPINPGEIERKTIRIRNQSTDIVRFDPLESPEGFSAAPIPQVLAPGESHELTIRFVPETFNSVNQILHIRSRDHGNLQISLNGAALPPQDNTPTILDQVDGQAIATWFHIPEVDHYQLEVSASSMFDSVESHEIPATGASPIEFRFNPMAFGKTNYVRVYSVNHSNRTAISEPISFLAAPPPPQMRFIDIIGSKIQAGWTFVEGAASYIIEISRTPEFRPLDILAQIEDLNLDNRETHLTSDLQPAEDYYVRVRGVNSSGKSAPSDTIVANSNPERTRIIAGISIQGNLDFERVLVGQTKTKTLRVANQGGGAFALESIALPQGFSSNFERSVINSHYEFDVTFEPTIPGLVDDTVSFSGGPFRGQNSIAVKGEAFAETRRILISEGLDFGPVPVGSTAVAQLTINNPGSEPVTITRTSHFPNPILDVTSPDWDNLIGLTLEPGENFGFPITYQPDSFTRHETEIWLSYDGPYSPFKTTIRGRGIPSLEIPFRLNNLNTPITHGLTNELLGTDYVADLWIGASQNSLFTRVGQAEFTDPGVFDLGIINLPIDPDADGTWAQIRVWNKNLAEDYQSSPTRGQSQPFIITVPSGDATTPGTLSNLKPFTVGNCFGTGQLHAFPAASVTAGQQLELRIEDTCDDRIEWFFNGVLLAGSLTHRLTFDKVMVADSGRYEAIIETPDGPVRRSINVSVSPNTQVLALHRSTPDHFAFSFPTRNAHVYLVQESAALEKPEWAIVGACIGNGEKRVFETPKSVGEQRFYRTMQLDVGLDGTISIGGGTAPETIHGKMYLVSVVDGSPEFGASGSFIFSTDNDSQRYTIEGLDGIPSSRGSFTYQKQSSDSGILTIEDSILGATFTHLLTFDTNRSGLYVLKDQAGKSYQVAQFSEMN